MKIAHKLLNNVLYVGLKGELDEHVAATTRESMDLLFDKCKMVKVVIDLSELDFMDSTGIGVIIGRFKKLRQKGIPIVIANPSKTADKLLSLSGIYELMPKVEY